VFCGLVSSARHPPLQIADSDFIRPGAIVSPQLYFMAALGTEVHGAGVASLCLKGGDLNHV
jgi:hypothetical protein